MPQSSIKDPGLSEELRKDGAAQQKAARIANAAAARGRTAVGRKGGQSGSFDDWTVAHLRQRAKELGLHGYSDKTKSQLISMLRNQ